MFNTLVCFPAGGEAMTVTCTDLTVRKIHAQIISPKKMVFLQETTRLTDGSWPTRSKALLLYSKHAVTELLSA